MTNPDTGPVVGDEPQLDPQLERQLRAVLREVADRYDPEAPLAPIEAHSSRWLQVAAAAIAVGGLAGLVVLAARSDDNGRSAPPGSVSTAPESIGMWPPGTSADAAMPETIADETTPPPRDVDRVAPAEPSPTSTAILEPPVVLWAPPPIPLDSPPATGLTALISGTVSYDEVNDCFLIEDTAGVKYPVVWPAGTTAAASGKGVVLADGRTVNVGDDVSGGGGYLDVAAQWSIPTGCSTPSDGQIAVFNAAFPLDL